MKNLKLYTLFFSTLLTCQLHASSDYTSYRDEKGMTHCLELNDKEETRILLAWDVGQSGKNRSVFYRKFDNTIKTNKGKSVFKDICKTWNKFDPTFLMLDGREIEFNNGKAPIYLDQALLQERTQKELEQLAQGKNRFLTAEDLARDSYVLGIFDPFKMQTHKELLTDVGAKTTTELYKAYINKKGITSDCSKLIGTCEYYLCREKNKSCGSEGYFLGFGYQYCSDSLKRLMNEVSPVGQKWLKTTATCLHQQMEEVKNTKSCGEIKRQAISSHDKCYSEVSFCSLKVTDMLKILEMIHPALLESGVIVEGVQVLGHCAGL